MAGDVHARDGLVRPFVDPVGADVLLLLSHHGEKVRGDVAREVVARSRGGTGTPATG